MTQIKNISPKWEIVELQEAVNATGGKRLPKNISYATQPTKHPYIRVSNLDDFSIDLTQTKFISANSYQKIKKYTFNTDDVYLSVTGTVGKVGIILKKHNGLCFNENLVKLEVKDKNNLLPKFLCYYLALKAAQQQIRFKANQVSPSKLNMGDVKKILIPLPPLTEQHKIVYVLDIIRSNIINTKNTRQALKNILPALRRELFICGLNRDTVQFKKTDIGAMPTHWNVMKLKEVANPSLNRNTDLTLGLQQALTLDSKLGLIPRKRSLGKKPERCKVVQYGQFVYNPMRLNIGSITFMTEPGPKIVSAEYEVFECDEKKLSTEFFNQYRFSEWWGWQIQKLGLGTRKRHYFMEVGESLIPIPPLVEQKQIVRHLKAFENKITFERKRESQLRKLFFVIGNQLISGKIQTDRINVDDID